jgi:hypothetical protein
MADRRGTGISSRLTGRGEAGGCVELRDGKYSFYSKTLIRKSSGTKLSEFLNYPTEGPQHQVLVRLVALGMLEGALKSGRHNYRVIPVRASVCYDPTERYLDDFWEARTSTRRRSFPGRSRRSRCFVTR